MVDTLRYKDWIDKATRDIKSAKLLKEHDCGNDVVAFHTQQAVEKLLKAYLIVKGQGLASTHSLLYLCKLCQKVDSEFKKYTRDCGFLNQYYIETRYPADTPLIVDDEDIKQCIAIADEIYKLIMNKIVL